MSRVSPSSRTAPTVEVVSPEDKRGSNARNITDGGAASSSGKRSVGEDLGADRSASSQTNTANTKNEFNNTSSEYSPSGIPGFDAFQNMVGRGRAAVDKAGTSLMWGSAAVSGLLYLGLGWRKLAVGIGALGIGSGYLLKSKVATIGQQADLDKVLIKTIKAMKISSEDQKKILEFMDGILSKYRSNKPAEPQPA